LSWARTSEEDQTHSSAGHGGETYDWEQFINYDGQSECNHTSSSSFNSNSDLAAVASERLWDEQDFQALPDELPLHNFPNIDLQSTVPHEEVKDHGNGLGISTQPSLSNSITPPPSLFDSSNTSATTESRVTPDTVRSRQFSQSEESESFKTNSSPIASALHQPGDSSESQGVRQTIRLERLVSHPCPACSRRFSSKEALDFHEDKSHPSFACSVPSCQKVFRKKRDLDRHCRAVHGPSTALPCGKRIRTRKDNICRHKRSCKICRGSFGDVNDNLLNDANLLLDRRAGF